jgi:pyridoxal phosphate-dependent aminotransferase EpsN
MMSTTPRPRLFLSPPHLGGSEERFVAEAFRTNWVAPLGPNVDGFERAFADYLGVPGAAALSSGTAALHLALLLAGVGPGDLVLVSDLTFVASVNPIRYVGAEPVLIDSDRATWNLDPALVEEAIRALEREGHRPKALVAVHLYGLLADLEPMQRVCREHGVTLIEDAAEALGARYGDKHAGTLGAIGIYSFNGNKIITTSGGGMLVAQDPALVARARFLATQARDPAPHYQHSALGFNYRMSNVVAGVGRGQMEVLEQHVAARIANYCYYCKEIGDWPGVSMMPAPPFGRNTHWLTCCLIDPQRFGCDRSTVLQRLDREFNIEARPVWKPMHLQPLYAQARHFGGAVAEELFERGLCLPSGSAMTDADRQRVVEALDVCRS